MNQKLSDKPRNIDAGKRYALANFVPKSKKCLDDATIVIVAKSCLV